MKQPKKILDVWMGQLAKLEHRTMNPTTFEEAFSEWFCTWITSHAYNNPSCFSFLPARTHFESLHCETIPKSIDCLTYTNQTLSTQEKAISREESTTDTFSFNFTSGIKIGIETETEINIPITQTEKISLSTELDFLTRQEWTKSRQRRWGITTPIQIPPRSSTVTTILLQEARFNGLLEIDYAPHFTAPGETAWHRHIDMYLADAGREDLILYNKNWGKVNERLAPLRDQPLWTLLGEDRLACLNAQCALSGVAGMNINTETRSSPIPLTDKNAAPAL